MPKGYLVFTKSGKTAHSLSALRPPVSIFAFTDNRTIADKLLLSYNVFPFIISFNGNKDTLTMIKECSDFLKGERLIKKGDWVVIVSGDNIGVKGSTNNVRVSIVE